MISNMRIDKLTRGFDLLPKIGTVLNFNEKLAT